MPTAAIRDTIRLAKLHEQQHGHLAVLLEQHVRNRVHFAIRLPSDNPVDSLFDFVVAYIDRVPEFIDAIRDITHRAGIEDFSEPYLKVAESYFLKPPEIIANHVGLHELMDEAYLAHRLMEEANDRFMLRASIPLIPMDMTMSNLIVHSLIGEPFANELDEAVNYTVERTMIRERVYDSNAFRDYVEAHKNDHWAEELQHWPCLTDELSIDLQFVGI